MVSQKRKTLPSSASDCDSESSGSKGNSNFGGDCRGTWRTRPSPASDCVSEGGGGTPKANSKFGGGCRLTTNKRKSSTSLEPPRKRERRDSEPTSVEAAQDLAKGAKRKASPDREPSSKKRRGDDDVADNKPEDRTEKLRRSDGPSSTSASTSTQRPLTFLPLEAGRADFEARYLQLGELGEGGFSVVYAGIRKSDSFPVAIKQIPLSDVDFISSCEHGRICLIPLEVVLMRKAAGHHTSEGQSAAVSLLDWFTLDEEVLLVMERPVPSVDLLTYLADIGHLGEETAKDIMKQLVEAAIQMHAAQVFHRDLKPENILVQTAADTLRVRIIDFGCGCFMQRTPYTLFSGTSAYTPPEYYMSGVYEAGSTTVWQLGAVLYEILDENNQFNTLAFLRREISISNKLSRDCQHFLHMCLASKPKERPTLEQMKLHPWLESAPERSQTTSSK